MTSFKSDLQTLFQRFSLVLILAGFTHSILAQPNPITLQDLWKLENQAADLHESGKLDKAEQFYQQTLKKYQQQYGPEHEGVGRLLFNLGLVHSARKNLKQAETYFLQSLKVRTKILGQEHLHVAKVHRELGYLYTTRQAYNKARNSFQSAAYIGEKWIKREEKTVDTYFDSLWLRLETQKQELLALSIHRSVEAGLELAGSKQTGKKNYSVAATEKTLRQSLKRQALALRLFKSYVSTMKSAHRNQLFFLAADLHQLGQSELTLNHPKAAYPQLEKSFVLYVALEGITAAKTKRVKDDLSRAYRKSQRYVFATLLKVRETLRKKSKQGALAKFTLKDAEETLLHTLRDREEKYGSKHGKLVSPLLLLGKVSKALGKKSKAAKYERRAAKIKKARKRPDRPK